ncbi:MAG TPA: FAD-dependent oxidoreductase [Geminicoccaceae bacterium]|nr:FAD-dependent oxidoreductase [Geminicoccaceae bacterium]
MPSYEYKPFPYTTPPELRGAATRRWPVVVVGAGPVGLAAAIDLALHDVDVLLLDDNDVVSTGSRAICWSKRTLEILDRLGCGERMAAKGVTWKVGRLYHREREIYSFDLLPEAGHKMPAFINLQQYYVEEYLVDRARELDDRIELRWKNRVVGLERFPDHVRLEIETPDGTYRAEAEYVLAADGCNSAIRSMLGLDFMGRIFEERFLITDVVTPVELPNERRFWFDPPFHNGQSALLHRQPDSMYRIDLQLGPDADPELEKRLERVIPRIQAVLGARTPFEIEWVSVYTFQCRRLERFVHDRVIFVGDSAHVVSPFGARGGNGGIQDVDNLVWKLAMILKGEAPRALLETYDEERVHGADENIRNSARATNFMTPKSAIEREFRGGVLALAADLPFARRLVNSGRLSVPCALAGMRLQTPDDGEVEGPMAPGAPCIDAPVTGSDGRSRWLLEHLGGAFTVLHFGCDAATPVDLRGLGNLRPTLHLLHVNGQAGATAAAEVLGDPTGLARARYGGAPGVTYLIRPDQHIAARFSHHDPAALGRALARATLAEAA